MKRHQNGKDLEVQNAMRSKGRKNGNGRGIKRKLKSGLPKEVHKDSPNGGLGCLQSTICENVPNEAILAADGSRHGIDKGLQTSLQNLHKR